MRVQAGLGEAGIVPAGAGPGVGETVAGELGAGWAGAMPEELGPGLA